LVPALSQMNPLNTKEMNIDLTKEDTEKEVNRDTKRRSERENE
jgi:hypothetical protein